MQVARTATEALKMLWQEKFFSAWKKMAATVERLDKDGYHFTPSELGMALNRAKFLTRRGKRVSYEYIQKYPYVEEKSAKRG